MADDAPCRVLLIDSYDSYTYNLYQGLAEVAGGTIVIGGRQHAHVAIGRGVEGFVGWGPTPFHLAGGPGMLPHSTLFPHTTPSPCHGHPER